MYFMEIYVGRLFGWVGWKGEQQTFLWWKDFKVFAVFVVVVVIFVVVVVVVVVESFSSCCCIIVRQSSYSNLMTSFAMMLAQISCVIEQKRFFLTRRGHVRDWRSKVALCATRPNLIGEKWRKKSKLDIMAIPREM